VTSIVCHSEHPSEQTELNLHTLDSEIVGTYLESRKTSLLYNPCLGLVAMIRKKNKEGGRGCVTLWALPIYIEKYLKAKQEFL
jgi:hypothetical protein